MSDMYSIFMSADMFLTDDEHAAAVSCYDAFLLHYNWMLKASLTKGVLRYGFYFKFHNLWHIVQQSKWINPAST